MNVIWWWTLVISLKTVKIFSIELPCEFSFDSHYGYTCRVQNFSNTIQSAKVTKIIGEHLFKDDDDKSHRTLHDFDVYRLTFWNLTISYLPANITQHFTKLRTLQVKQCGLKTLTRSKDFIKLRRLYLGFNEIKNIPTTYFWHFCQLEVLSLFQNQISSIPLMAFRDLISLKRLSLNGNRLKSIDSQMFANCVNMEVVDLDNNELKAIDGSLFAEQKRIRKVFMRGNKLKSIEVNFLANATLSVADFSKNPCIDFSLPQDGDYQRLQKIFLKYCKTPVEPTTMAPAMTTTKPRKKPKYVSSPIIYFENCNWRVREEFEHLYKTFPFKPRYKPTKSTLKPSKLRKLICIYGSVQKNSTNYTEICTTDKMKPIDD